MTSSIDAMKCPHQAVQLSDGTANAEQEKPLAVDAIAPGAAHYLEAPDEVEEAPRVAPPCQHRWC